MPNIISTLTKPGQYGDVVEVGCSNQAEKATDVLKECWHSFAYTRGILFLQPPKVLSRQLVGQTQPPVAGWAITYSEDVSEAHMNLYI